ncbi:MAG: methyltransferase [Candidatus Woesearchaeota archaeon]
MNILICDEGFEDVVVKDLKNRKIAAKIESPTVISFEADYDTCVLLAYSLQSAIKLITEVSVFEASSDLEETAKRINVPKVQGSVNVSCVRKGGHLYRSVDLASQIAQKFEHTSYKKADNYVFIYVKDDKGYSGLDISARTLSKRDYKVFTGAASLRGTVAYNTLLLADATEKDVILDPFMGSGTIVLEAGLYFSKTSPFLFSKDKFACFNKEIFDSYDAKRKPDQFDIYGFDSLLKFLKYTQKNAKIADINKNVHISKVSIDWLDTKMEEHSVDKIVTHPPFLTEHGSKTKIMKVYKDFFNQADFVLKKKGTITLITNEQSESYITESNEIFKETHRRIVFEGQQELLILQYTR